MLSCENPISNPGQINWYYGESSCFILHHRVSSVRSELRSELRERLSYVRTLPAEHLLLVRATIGKKELYEGLLLYGW